MPNAVDESDLSSVESSEEEALSKNSKSPGKPKISKKKKVNIDDEEYEEYRLRHVLPAPRASTYATKSLFEQIRKGDIELCPEYQRDVVWNDAKQIAVIDSILRRYYVPPVIMMVKTLEDGSEEKVCIDGKQRLTSISRFMEGQIPYQDAETREKFYYMDAPGVEVKNKQILPDRLKTTFDNRQIVCIEYSELPDEDERDIFQRVQLGMALTPSEKLHVISSPRANFVRSILNKKLSPDSEISRSLEWERRRGNDFRAITHCVIAVEKMKANPNELPTGAETHYTIEKWLRSDAPVSGYIKSRIEKTFDTYNRLVGTKGLSDVFHKVKGIPTKLAPVEFTCAAILIARNLDKMDQAEMVKGIKGMRENVRANHKDIRGNSDVVGTIMVYILGLDGIIVDPTSKKRKRAAAVSKSSSASRAASRATPEEEGEVAESLVTTPSKKKKSSSTSKSSKSPARGGDVEMGDDTIAANFSRKSKSKTKASSATADAEEEEGEVDDGDGDGTRSVTLGAGAMDLSQPMPTPPSSMPQPQFTGYMMPPYGYMPGWGYQPPPAGAMMQGPLPPPPPVTPTPVQTSATNAGAGQGGANPTGLLSPKSPTGLDGRSSSVGSPGGSGWGRGHSSGSVGRVGTGSNPSVSDSGWGGRGRSKG